MVERDEVLLTVRERWRVVRSGDLGGMCEEECFEVLDFTRKQQTSYVIQFEVHARLMSSRLTPELISCDDQVLLSQKSALANHTPPF